MDSTTETGESGEETGETGDTGPVVEDTITATFLQVGTGGVVRVDWETPEPADGKVYFGEGGALDRVYAATDSADGLTHSALVIALAGGVPWQLQAVSASGRHTWSSQVETITPPSPPETLPAVTLDAGSDTALDGLVLTSNSGQTIMLLDRQGRYVWWSETTFGYNILGMALADDGLTVEWLEDDDSGRNISYFRRKAVDGSVDVTFPVPYGHHGFTPLPEGGWAFIELDVRSWDGHDVKGDRIVEVDAAGTEVREVWSAWDDFTPSTDGADPGSEWSHFNGVQYVADRDAYLVSAYLFNAAYLIDRTTGAIVWQLGGDGGDFTFVDGAPFAHIHVARMLPDGHVLLFDNGEEDTGSRVVEYALDEAAGTATEVWAYDAGGAIFGHVRGNVDRMETGDTFIAWGSAGTMTQVDPGGNVLWQAELPTEDSPGFSHVELSLGGVGEMTGR